MKPRVCQKPRVWKRPRVSGVVASVPECVLPSTPCMSETPCVEATPCVSGVVASVPGCVLPSTPCVTKAPCVSEQPCVSEARCVRKTVCVRSLYVREMAVGMREHAAVSPGVNVMSWCVSVVTRRCMWVEWRRLRRKRNEGRVAAVAISGTAPGLHGGEREFRPVQRTRPPRARLRE